MAGAYAPELQVKQYVAEVTNGAGQTFRVFKTGRDSHYLFAQVDGYGCDTGLHVPVAKRDLARPVARALANGCGLDLRRAA